MSRKAYTLAIAPLVSVQLLACGGGGGSDSATTNCAQVSGNWTVTDSATITCTGSFGSGTQTPTGTSTVQITQNGCNVSFLTPAPASLPRSGSMVANSIQLSGPLAAGSAGVAFTQNQIAFSGAVSSDGKTINLTGNGVASGTASGATGSCTATSTETFTR